MIVAEGHYIPFDPGGRTRSCAAFSAIADPGVLAFTAGDGVWRSRCKRWGVKMVWIRRKLWVRVDSNDPDEA